MGKLIIAFLIQFAITSACFAQRKTIDSLEMKLRTAADDTNKVNLLGRLSNQNLYSKPDSALLFAQDGYNLAEQLGDIKGQSFCLVRMAIAHLYLGNAPKALELLHKAHAISENINDNIGVIRVLTTISNVYATQKDYNKALLYVKEALRIADSIKLDSTYNRSSANLFAIILDDLGDTYNSLNQLDSALIYSEKGYSISLRLKEPFKISDIQRIFGDIYLKKNNPSLALKYYHESILSTNPGISAPSLSQTFLSIAKLYLAEKQTDSVIFYTKKALEIAQSGNFVNSILDASQLLSEVYENKRQLTEAFRYFKIASMAKDTIFSQDKVRQLLSQDFEEKMKQQEITAANNRYKDQIQIYVLLAGLTALLIIALILIRNNRQKQKAYILLQKQKKEIDIQKAKAEDTLYELKLTQAQLVQSEKMASLGELTAGIAHEIQNPLNFVNNFSEVNKELIGELVEEVDKGNTEEVKAIAKDINDNSEKINYHGKRADAIVKGMLQHSRSSSGQKEPTDISALCDEYLRLAYHGLRAKDKSFNAKFETSFDNSIGKINIVPQEIGRVILNLINNAFYAASQPSKGGLSESDVNKTPTVWVSTKKLGGKVQINVRDNGPGIPDAIKEKIFQPFFTTKPTGQGTGLGLSLAYDIITKGHAGDLQVETKEGEGATFIIILPAN